jgi:predicted cobalt transporter CbtA
MVLARRRPPLVDRRDRRVGKGTKRTGDLRASALGSRLGFQPSDDASYTISVANFVVSVFYTLLTVACVNVRLPGQPVRSWFWDVGGF